MFMVKMDRKEPQEILETINLTLITNCIVKIFNMLQILSIPDNNYLFIIMSSVS